MTDASKTAGLQEFTYYTTHEVPVPLRDYPHVVDFEPKTRDLYQAVTQTGEVLTGSSSRVVTDKSLAHSRSTESGWSFGLNAIGAVAQGVNVGGNFGLHSSSTSGDQESTNIQSDASRERRETQGTTTNITQMFNLLTGYHAGTNRAVFLMLPRPHITQATDHRSFANGLRRIEGIQEFFFVVTRPSSVPGLCIEALLETAHLREGARVDLPAVPQRTQHIIVSVQSEGDGAREIDTFQESVQLMPQGWRIDRAKGDDRGHGGIELTRESEDDYGLFDRFNRIGFDWQRNAAASGTIGDAVIRLNYYASDDSTVKVAGAIMNSPRGVRHVRLHFNVHLVAEDPAPMSDEEPEVSSEEPLLITSRSLPVCFLSGHCPVVEDHEPPGPIGLTHVVDEQPVWLDRVLVRSAASGDHGSLARHVLRKLESALTTSWRLPTRKPYGECGFLDTEYVRNRVRSLMRPEVAETPLTSTDGVPQSVIEAFGDESTVAQALEPDLATFMRRTSLPLREALGVRRTLLERIAAVASKHPSTGRR